MKLKLIHLMHKKNLNLNNNIKILLCNNFYTYNLPIF